MWTMPALPLTLPDLWTVVLTTLAIYRVSAALVDEEGPLHLFLRWRRFAWKYLPAWIGQGFSCFYCLSFWAALFFAVLVSPALDLGTVLVWLASAAAVQILRHEEDRRNGFLTAAARSATRN